MRGRERERLREGERGREGEGEGEGDREKKRDREKKKRELVARENASHQAKIGNFKLSFVSQLDGAAIHETVKIGLFDQSIMVPTLAQSKWHSASKENADEISNLDVHRREADKALFGDKKPLVHQVVLQCFAPPLRRYVHGLATSHSGGQETSSESAPKGPSMEDGADLALFRDSPIGGGGDVWIVVD